MPHTLILGQTDSGKSTLGRALSSSYRRRGVETLVFDPIREPTWHQVASKVCHDKEEFLHYFWRSKSCAVFIDEGSESIGTHDKDMKQCLTMGRHNGHNVHVLSQRGADMNKSVRDQCRYLALFVISVDDAKILSKEFNKPGLLNASELEPGSYLWCDRYKIFEERKVF